MEQAFFIVKDIIAFTLASSNALMEYIAQQGDKVDMQVSKVDPDSSKVIFLPKKLQNSWKQKSQS